MFNIYDLAHGTAAALFGMFALWAAASNRHWFLRTAVVSSAILVTLLIPAYEVAITFTVQTLLIVGAMALWRRRRNHSQPAPSMADNQPSVRLQLSMETMMLLVVIVAVLTAVASRAPTLQFYNCSLAAWDGVMSAQIALVCVWIVCGRAPWWIRAAALPLVLLPLAMEYVGVRWTIHVVRHWYMVTFQSLRPTSTARYIEIALRDFWPGSLSWSKPIAFGMALACTWLYCNRTAGWFDPFDEAPASPTSASAAHRRQFRAKMTAVILVILVAIFPLVLLDKMTTPTPIPAIDLPSPNGFDDIVAAGNMIGPAASQKLQNWDQLTTDQLRDELAKHNAAFDRLDLGLSRPCRHPYAFQPWTAEYARSQMQLWNGFRAKAALARRTQDLEEELESYFTLLRLAQEEGRGGTNYVGGIFAQYEKDGYTGIWDCVDRLSAEMCIELVMRLRELDQRREPWENRLAVQRAIEDNSGWERRLHRILIDWSGEEFRKWERIEEWRRIAQLRMLIIKLALHAYKLEHNRLPDSLEELIPLYMPEMPIDPFDGERMRYRRNGVKYVVYSCGPDEDDDGGAPRDVLNGEEIGDITDEALFEPPIFQPSIGPP